MRREFHQFRFDLRERDGHGLILSINLREHFGLVRAQPYETAVRVMKSRKRRDCGRCEQQRVPIPEVRFAEAGEGADYTRQLETCAGFAKVGWLYRYALAGEERNHQVTEADDDIENENQA